MGFCTAGKAAKDKLEGYSLDLLHSAQCTVCPLNGQRGLKHPNMKPSGHPHPIVYMLGEAPGKEEDEKGIPFVGKAGRTLHKAIPNDWINDVRFSNTVRTRPPENRNPTAIEMECCRPSVEADIEKSRPKAIFGLGAVPLRWALNQPKISQWVGRRVPVRIGKHSCWYFPLYHPSYINRVRNEDHGPEIEFAWGLHLQRAFQLAEELPTPVVHRREHALEGISYVTGKTGDFNTVASMLASMRDEPVVGVDYETNRLRPYSQKAKILSIAVASRDHAFAFPLYHRAARWTDKELKLLDELWADFLYQSKGRKVAHHLAFEMEWSGYFYGRDCLRAGKWGCSEAQAYVLDARHGTHSLDFLCLQYFGLHLKQISSTLDVEKLDATDLERVLPYNALDAKYHRRLYLVQGDRVRAEGLYEVYEHQLRRIPTVVLTQMQGVPVDQAAVTKFRKKYERELDKIEAEIDATPEAKKFYKQTNHHYRPSALRDVGIMLGKVVGEPVEGADEAVLREIRHPIAKLTLRWRKANKLLSTYVKPVMTGSPHLFPDGMLHPIIKLSSTTTWRTSEEDPNLQNWPKRQTREVRQQIRPEPDQRVVSFDYGQIQARNVAMESLDKNLIKAFHERYDIHADWMQRIAKAHPAWVNGGLLDKEVAKKKRNEAKNGLVFPILFGARANKLSYVLGVPKPTCEKLRNQFLGMFPGVGEWHEELNKFYQANGYVTGLSGFRRYAPISANELINTPIQGDEALIVCDAWCRLSERSLQASMEIHDDLTFIWHKKDIERNAEQVIDIMLNVPFKWAQVVPIVVEMSVGEDWHHMQEVGTYSSDDWKGSDPNLGAWADGTGWANEDGLENISRKGRRLGKALYE